MKHSNGNSTSRLIRRIALYLAPVIFTLIILKVTPDKSEQDAGVQEDWFNVDFTEYEAVRLFQEYLRIDTSYPNGNEIEGAEFLARVLEAEGIPVHIERLGSRNANLWAEIPGESSEALVLHNHLDIEPILRPEGWRFDPFSATIHGPFLYGRGAFDMKSITIAQLMAVLELKRSGKRPKKSVIFLATGDEERDSWLGTRRLLAAHPEWQDKFWGVLTEGGAVEANNLETVRYWGTEFHQKRFVDIWVCDNSKQRLEDLRFGLHKRSMERRITPPIRDFFLEFAPSRDRPVAKRLLADPDTILERLQAYPGDIDETVVTPYTEFIMRSRVIGFPVGEAEGGGHQLRLILHLNSDEEVSDVWGELIGDALEGFTYTVVEAHPPVPASPLDHEIFTGIDDYMKGRFPDIDHGPLSIPFVATDARYFRQYGIPAYGFSPFLMLAADASKMKGVDERIPVPPFLEGVEIYSGLVRELTQN